MLARAKRPHELPCGIRAPGRELVQFCITLKNEPGALARVAEEMARYNVNILSGHIRARPGEEHGYVTFFADVTNATSSLEGLVVALKALDVVVEVDVLEAIVPGIIIDRAHFPLKFMGEDVVIIDLRMVGHMFSRLDEVFGTGASVILFEMGLRAGEVAAKELKRYGMPLPAVMNVLSALAVARGWGIPEVVEWRERAGLKEPKVIRIWENFECKPLAGQRRAPNSHFMRGVIAGLMAEFTGGRYKVREVKCLAKGDPCCEFLIEEAGGGES